MWQPSYGTTVTFDATGLCIVLFNVPVAGITIRRQAIGTTTAAVLVALNAILVEPDENDPFTGTIVRFDGVAAIAANIPKWDNVAKITAAELTSHGVNIPATVQYEREFKGWAAFNGGSQISCVALIGAENDTVVIGVHDVSQ